MSEPRLLPEESLGRFIEQGLVPVTHRMRDENGGACGIGAAFRHWDEAELCLGRYYTWGYAFGFDLTLGNYGSRVAEEVWRSWNCSRKPQSGFARFRQGFEDARALVKLLKNPPLEKACGPVAIKERATA